MQRIKPQALRRGLRLFALCACLLSVYVLAQTLDKDPTCKFDIHGKREATSPSTGDDKDNCELTGDNGWRTDLKLVSIDIHHDDKSPNKGVDFERSHQFNHRIVAIEMNYDGPSGPWSCISGDLDKEDKTTFDSFASGARILSVELFWQVYWYQYCSIGCGTYCCRETRVKSTTTKAVQGIIIKMDDGTSVDIGLTNKSEILADPSLMSKIEFLATDSTDLHFFAPYSEQKDEKKLLMMTNLGFHTATPTLCVHCQDSLFTDSWETKNSLPWPKDAAGDDPVTLITVLGAPGEGTFDLYHKTDNWGITDTISELYGTRWFCGAYHWKFWQDDTDFQGLQLPEDMEQYVIDNEADGYLTHADYAFVDYVEPQKVPTSLTQHEIGYSRYHLEFTLPNHLNVADPMATPLDTIKQSTTLQVDQCIPLNTSFASPISPDTFAFEYPTSPKETWELPHWTHDTGRGLFDGQDMNCNQTVTTVLWEEKADGTQKEIGNGDDIVDMFNPEQTVWDWDATTSQNIGWQTVTEFDIYVDKVGVPPDRYTYFFEAVYNNTYDTRVFDPAFYFHVDLTDQCASSELITNEILDIEYTLGSAVELQDFVPYSDSFSDEFGEFTCGDYLYKFFDPLTMEELDYLNVNLVSRKIELWTQDSNLIGTHDVALAFWLELYPDVYTEVPFQVTVLFVSSGILVNQAPDIKVESKEYTMHIGEKLLIEVEAFDEEGDEFEYTFNLGPAILFTKYEHDGNSVKFHVHPVHGTPLFPYTIVFNLVDVNGQKRTVNIVVNLVDPDEEVAEVKRKRNFVFNPRAPKPIHPQVSLKSQLKIEWDQSMLVPDNFTDFINTTHLKLEALPSQTNRIENLNFTWNVTDFTKDDMTIQMYWEKPEFVSTSGLEDRIKMTFLETSFFKSKKTGLQVNENETLQRALPPQMNPGRTTDALEKVAEVVEASAQVGALGTTIISILLSTSLQLLWTLVNSLQIITHMPLLNVMTPANALFYLQGIASLANFDVMPAGDWMESMFNFSHPWLDEKENEAEAVRLLAEESVEGEDEGEADEEVNDEEEKVSVKVRFEQMGYESINIIENMGTVYFICLILIIVCIVLMILFFMSLCCVKVTPTYLWLKQAILWGIPIRFAFEGYLEFAVGSFINLQILSVNNLSDWINNLTFLACILVAVILPIFALLFIFLRSQEFDNKEVRKKWESLYEGLSTTNAAGIYWPVVFLVRRFILAVSIAFMADLAFLQIQIFVFVVSLMIIFTGYTRPFETRQLNNQEILNEVCILLCSYHLFIFTDFVPSPTTRNQMGWSMVGVTMINIILNLSLMIIQVLRQGCVWLYRYHVTKEELKRTKSIVKGLKARRKIVRVVLRQEKKERMEAEAKGLVKGPESEADESFQGEELAKNDASAHSQVSLLVPLKTYTGTRLAPMSSISLLRGRPQNVKKEDGLLLSHPDNDENAESRLSQVPLVVKGRSELELSHLQPVGLKFTLPVTENPPSGMPSQSVSAMPSQLGSPKFGSMSVHEGGPSLKNHAPQFLTPKSRKTADFANGKPTEKAQASPPVDNQSYINQFLKGMSSQNKQPLLDQAPANDLSSFIKDFQAANEAVGTTQPGESEPVAKPILAITRPKPVQATTRPSRNINTKNLISQSSKGSQPSRSSSQKVTLQPYLHRNYPPQPPKETLHSIAQGMPNVAQAPTAAQLLLGEQGPTTHSQRVSLIDQKYPMSKPLTDPINHKIDQLRRRMEARGRSVSPLAKVYDGIQQDLTGSTPPKKPFEEGDESLNSRSARLNRQPSKVIDYEDPLGHSQRLVKPRNSTLGPHTMGMSSAAPVPSSRDRELDDLDRYWQSLRKDHKPDSKGLDTDTDVKQLINVAKMSRQEVINHILSSGTGGRNTGHLNSGTSLRNQRSGGTSGTNAGVPDVPDFLNSSQRKPEKGGELSNVYF